MFPTVTRAAAAAAAAAYDVRARHRWANHTGKDNTDLTRLDTNSFIGFAYTSYCFLRS